MADSDALRECNTHGCRQLCRERFCDDCKRARWKEQDNDPARQARKLFYKTDAWTALREQTAAQAGGFCECTRAGCHEERCNKLGKLADHRIPREPCRGGNQNTHHAQCPVCDDPENLQWLCIPCHNSKTASENPQFQAKLEAQVILVAGPPGSGKTTYVVQNFKPGDIMIDLDQIMRALTGIKNRNYPEGVWKLAWEARDAILKAVPRLRGVKRVWIVDSAPKRERREHLATSLGATVVMLDVGEQECLSRIKADESRDQAIAWEVFVRRWWSQYEPSMSDQRVAMEFG